MAVSDPGKQTGLVGLTPVLAGSSDVNCMDTHEFVDGGFLQEVNRQLLHPLGLALECAYTVTITDPLIRGGEKTEIGMKNTMFVRVWDYRDDPEGIRFGPPLPDEVKADAVYAAMINRMPDRHKALGYWVQPADDDSTEIKDT